MNGPIVPGENHDLGVDTVERVITQLKELFRGKELSVVATCIGVTGRVHPYVNLAVDVDHEGISLQDVSTPIGPAKSMNIQFTKENGEVMKTSFYVFQTGRQFNPKLLIIGNMISIEGFGKQRDNANRRSLVVFINDMKSP
jgi:hypothetical protein